MLHSYLAEVHGTQLIWIDQPPAPLERRRVMVVIEDVPALTAQPINHIHQRVQNFTAARGCMGSTSREQVLNDLAAMREDWARNPLGDAKAK
jgi:hypothetical protein